MVWGKFRGRFSQDIRGQIQLKKEASTGWRIEGNQQMSRQLIDMALKSFHTSCLVSAVKSSVLFKNVGNAEYWNCRLHSSSRH